MRYFLVALLLILFAQSAQPAQASRCDERKPLDPGWYCEFGYWIPGMVTWHSWMTEPPRHFTTRALFQNDGVLEATAALHDIPLKGAEGYVALNSPATLGWMVWLQSPLDGTWIPTRDADSAKREDIYFHTVYASSGIELSYTLAQRLGVVDWVNEDGTRYPTLAICISDDPPELTPECAGEAVNY